MAPDKLDDEIEINDEIEEDLDEAIGDDLDDDLDEVVVGDDEVEEIPVADVRATEEEDEDVPDADDVEASLDVILKERLVVEDVEGSAGDPALLERGHQSTLVDDRAATRVHEPGV